MVKADLAFAKASGAGYDVQHRGNVEEVSSAVRSSSARSDGSSSSETGNF